MAPTTAGRRRLRILAAALLALTAAGSGAVQASPAAQLPSAPAPAHVTGQDVGQWLDGLVPGALDSTGIPGAVISVVAGDEVIAARGYGQAQTGTPGKAAAAEDTLFRIASVSKTITATAVMQLVERGELNLDTGISAYLDFDLPQPKGEVTLRHLLTHTAGFEERIRGLVSPDAAPPLRDTVAIDPPAQVFRPGTVPAYSNYGNALAGYIVERTADQPFADYVEQHIFDPLDMDSTSFAQPLPPHLADRLAFGYPDEAGPPLPFEYVAAAPAGAASGTATDMGRFMLALLGAGPQPERVLHPATLAQMLSPGLTDGDSLEPRMTLGFFDHSRSGHRALGHDGDSQVFHTAMRLYPDAGLGIFVAFNGNGRSPSDPTALRQALTEGFADRYLPGGPGGLENSGTVPSEGTDTPSPASGDAFHRAETIAGVYQQSRAPFSSFAGLISLTGQTVLTAQPDGTLLASPDPAGFAPAVYEEIGPWVWRQADGQEILAAHAPDGRVEAIRFSSAFALLPVAAWQDARVVLPLLTGCLGVLALTVIAWPLRYALHRRHRIPGASPRRLSGILTGAGVGAGLAAAAGWIAVLVSIASYRDVPDAPLRVLQLLQAMALAAVVPAGAWVIEAIRLRPGAAALAGRVLILLALAGWGWFALSFGLLAADVSY
ncbi:beta-lactamase family protein [Arthrobacter sp. zg-Y916]|uniref:serine hydrolase domain-containing protein n=1 Tax=Arthrobacter sp. zg-Y916 TaxID=2894190 RepID=UPI001E3B5729|nr:serine hydrolase domain-containing protein [Arthrobacter sp. zg-Y916]MCC9192249.1 beta-lactamase family protein [Arthrobacter sp. zg-Y916]